MACSAAALLAASPSQADVTAQQVWDNWKESLNVYGDGGVSIGSETMAGNSLTVSDIVLSMDDGDVSVESLIGTIVFTEQGDGTVSVLMSETNPITIDAGPGDIAKITVTQAGVQMVVSGTPEEMTYDVSADRISISLDEITDSGDAMPVEAIVTMNGLAGAYTSITGPDLTQIVYDVAASSIDIFFDTDQPDEEVLVNFSGKIMDLGFAGSVATPTDMDMDAPETMFIDGFSVDAGYSFGNSTYIFAFQDGTDTANGTATATGGSLGVMMDYDGAEYSNSLTDLAVSFTGSAIPLPVDFSMGEYGLSVSLPLSQSDVPSEFGAEFRLVDLAVSDMIWSMADPGGVLPHDPATAIFKVSGLGSLFFDLLDPAQAMQIADSELPGTLESLSLDDLTVRLAGAEVLGSGAFVFDNTDMMTFPGFPRPEGKLDIAVNGANGLIDKLVQMGLLPQEQVMGARMMMGVFTTPVGDDMLTSTIEVNDQGHVIANGQRLQ